MSDVGPDHDTNDHEEAPVAPLTPEQFDVELQKLYDLNDQASIGPLSEAYRAIVRERDEVRLRRQEVITMCVHLECAMETLRQQLITMKAEREAACGELLVNIDDTPVGSLAGKLVCANRALRSEVSAVKRQLTEMAERVAEAESIPVAAHNRIVAQTITAMDAERVSFEQEIERLKKVYAWAKKVDATWSADEPYPPYMDCVDTDALVGLRKALAGTKEGA